MNERRAVAAPFSIFEATTPMTLSKSIKSHFADVMVILDFQKK